MSVKRQLGKIIFQIEQSERINVSGSHYSLMERPIALSNTPRMSCMYLWLQQQQRALFASPYKHMQYCKSYF